MIIPALYPWQHDAWQNWQHYLTQEKVPHALLLHGCRGSGINDFALRLCCSLLCDSDNNAKPCLECSSCRLFIADNHPDCLIIEAEQDQIKIEQVRFAIDFLQLSRHYLRYKVVLLKEVDNLNYAAANSLLKTLEEPPEESVILMTCRQPSMLMATIRSRCHRIHLKEPGAEAITWLSEQISISEAEAQQRLMLANNSPLAALDQKLDKSDKSLFYSKLKQWQTRQIPTHDLVDQWCDKPAVEIQQWLLEYLQRTILMEAKEMSSDQANSTSSKSNLGNLLYWLYQRQIERCHLAKQNINPRLLLEGSLLEWRKACLSN